MWWQRWRNLSETGDLARVEILQELISLPLVHEFVVLPWGGATLYQ